MRTNAEVELVQRLASGGAGPSDIAVATGIPRGTIRHWLAAEVPLATTSGCPTCGHAHDFAALPASTYAYGFGMYLGDGCILKHSRGVWRLEISLDSKYPAVIEECAHAVKALMPKSRVAVVDQAPARYKIVRSYSKAWPCLFPQHGPGPKHKRKIELEPWQQEIVGAQPEQFIRGLIHSDGCRVRNHVNGKDYTRYFFCQVSEDIKALFCRSLDQLGIHYTRNDHKNVSIARRPDVARLDEFVGAKL